MNWGSSLVGGPDHCAFRDTTYDTPPVSKAPTSAAPTNNNIFAILSLFQTVDRNLKPSIQNLCPEETTESFSFIVFENAKMNDADVSKQIQQMVRFIRQEAEEKANEILLSAEEEFNIEKLQLVEAEKRKIREEYERKKKQVEVRKKIEYSMQLNASRLKVLQAQDDLVNSMKESAGKDLLNVSNEKDSYRNLLKNLIVQCLLRLKEPSVLLRCREADRGLVASVLEEAKQEYAKKAKVHSPKITLDDHVYLPPPPSNQNAHGRFCSGGVVLASQDGKIVYENTLDARLDVVFRQKLPEIRKLLFAKATA